MAKVIEKVKDEISTKFERFKQFVELIEGREQAGQRADIILSPKTPQTSTNLTASQVDFIAISFAVVKQFPEFGPLEDLAKEFLYSSMSKEGWGVDRAIAYEQAIGEKRLMELGFKPKPEEKHVKSES